MLIFRWLLPLLVKTDAATFEVNVKYYSQFLLQLTAPQTQKKFIAQNSYERKIFHIVFKEENVINKCLVNRWFHLMLSDNWFHWQKWWQLGNFVILASGHCLFKNFLIEKNSFLIRTIQIESQFPSTSSTFSYHFTCFT